MNKCLQIALQFRKEGDIPQALFYLTKACEEGDALALFYTADGAWSAICKRHSFTPVRLIGRDAPMGPICI
jgi:hypothetical protein